MAQRVVWWLKAELVLLLAVLAACSTAPSLPPAPELQTALAIPVTDSVQGSAAATGLLERVEEALTAGQTASASLLLERALRLVPDSSWLYRRQALLELQQGQAAAAEGAVRRALQLAAQDDHAETRRYRANLLEILATSLAGQNKAAAAAAASAEAQALWR